MTAGSFQTKRTRRFRSNTPVDQTKRLVVLKSHPFKNCVFSPVLRSSSEFQYTQSNFDEKTKKKKQTIISYTKTGSTKIYKFDREKKISVFIYRYNILTDKNRFSATLSLLINCVGQLIDGNENE